MWTYEGMLQPWHPVPSKQTSELPEDMENMDELQLIMGSITG